MNIDAITKQINEFVREHEAVLAEIPGRQSAMLELAAVIGVQEHYRSNGFVAEIVNPQGQNEFRIKTGTRGDPWNYSRVLNNSTRRSERGLVSI